MMKSVNPFRKNVTKNENFQNSMLGLVFSRYRLCLTSGIPYDI